MVFGAKCVAYRQRRNSKPSYLKIASGEESLKNKTKTPNTWDLCRLYYHAYPKWVTKQANRILVAIRISKAITDDDIKTQSKYLIQEYVTSRLRKQGLMSAKSLLQKKLGALRHNPLQELSKELQYFGAELEKLYPELFTNVGKQLCIQFKKRKAVSDALSTFADNLFKDKITWGRILSLFAMTAAIAVDAVQLGHNDYVGHLVDVFVQAVEKHLSAWIINQSGWTDLRKTFRTTTDAATIWSISVSSIFLGFLITLSTLVSMNSP